MSACETPSAIRERIRSRRSAANRRAIHVCSIACARTSLIRANVSSREGAVVTRQSCQLQVVMSTAGCRLAGHPSSRSARDQRAQNAVQVTNEHHQTTNHPSLPGYGASDRRGDVSPGRHDLDHHSYLPFSPGDDGSSRVVKGREPGRGHHRRVVGHRRGYGARAERMYEQTSMTAQDIAEIIAFAVSRPRGVSLNEILVRPTGQAG